MPVEGRGDNTTTLEGKSTVVTEERGGNIKNEWPPSRLSKS